MNIANNAQVVPFAKQTHRIAELCYTFPVKALCLDLHVNGFKTGAHRNIEGTDSYFIAADDMTPFAYMETVAEASAITYVLALIEKYDSLRPLPYSGYQQIQQVPLCVL